MVNQLWVNLWTQIKLRYIGRFYSKWKLLRVKTTSFYISRPVYTILQSACVCRRKSLKKINYRPPRKLQVSSLVKCNLKPNLKYTNSTLRVKTTLNSKKLRYPTGNENLIITSVGPSRQPEMYRHQKVREFILLNNYISENKVPTQHF